MIRRELLIYLDPDFALVKEKSNHAAMSHEIVSF
jgi:hypothetical protein